MQTRKQSIEAEGDSMVSRGIALSIYIYRNIFTRNIALASRANVSSALRAGFSWAQIVSLGLGSLVPGLIVVYSRLPERIPTKVQGFQA